MIKSAFIKFASLGALVMLPTSKGRYLLQRNGENDYRPGKIRPPGGHLDPGDKGSMEKCIIREIEEEFGQKVDPEDLTFLGFEPRRKFWGNAIFEWKGHNLSPGDYQASNSPDEKIELVETDLKDPDYEGPQLQKLLSEEAKKAGDELGFADQVVKSAGGKSQFHRPENWDRMETLDDDWSLFAGQNDWEEGKTWIWVQATQPDSYNKCDRVWMRVKYPEVEERTRADDEADHAHGEKVYKAFRRHLRQYHRRNSCTWGEAAREAIKLMSTPLVQDHGVDTLEWVKKASIAVDFDGTLATSVNGGYDPAKAGPPVPEMLAKVRNWIGRGWKVVIFSARAGTKEGRDGIRTWLGKHNLPTDLKITNKKTPDMRRFYDDRAVQVIKNTGVEVQPDKEEIEEAKELAPELAEGIQSEEAVKVGKAKQAAPEPEPEKGESSLFTIAEVRGRARQEFQKDIDEAVTKGDMSADFAFHLQETEDGTSCLISAPDGADESEERVAKGIANTFCDAVDLDYEIGRSPETSQVLTCSHGARQAQQAVKMAAGPVVPMTSEQLLEGTELGTPEIPLRGPKAISYALENLDLDKVRATHQDVLDRKLKSKRPRAMQVLGYLDGMQRAELQPQDLLISRVPVIPPQFRPFSVSETTFTPGDANELYRDLIGVRDLYDQTYPLLGEDGSSEIRRNLYDAVSAVYGFGEPISPKSRERGVKGFLKQVVGTGPKWSFPQRQLLAKEQDYVGRSVTTVNPDLEMDEVGVPDEAAWTLFAPHVQRRLVRRGMSQVQALESIRDRSKVAEQELDLEMKERPVMYSRAPAWHKFSTIGGFAKRIKGNSIAVSPLVTTGLNMDFDGDTANIHVPATPEAVDDIRTKLLPSKMVLADKDPEQAVNLPKQELILGLFLAQNRPSGVTHIFGSREEALAAIKSGRIDLNDDVEIGVQTPGLPAAG